MREITLGVVAEGPSDYVVIKNLLGTYVASKKIENCLLTFKSLQPYVDNTSKSGYSEGGWLLVYKWCLSNTPGERENKYFSKGLFADDMDEFRCSALLVHMDADICTEIRDKTTLLPVPSQNDDPITRGSFISGTVANWLWPDGWVNDPRYIIAPAVESTESWLVAGLSDEDVAPETNSEIQQRLAHLDYLIVRKKPIPQKIKNPNKSASNYEKISLVASENIARIIDRCPHFKLVADKAIDFLSASMMRA